MLNTNLLSVKPVFEVFSVGGTLVTTIALGELTGKGSHFGEGAYESFLQKLKDVTCEQLF